MEIVYPRWIVWILLSCGFIFAIGYSESTDQVDGLNGNARVRGVNLGGWLVIEGWIKPSLFDDIPNGDMLDGTEVQFKSLTLNKYISADNGGGAMVAVNREAPLSWETFRSIKSSTQFRSITWINFFQQLWRVSESLFQFRTSGGQFLTCDGDGGIVTAAADSPSSDETFYIERNSENRVHFKLKSGTYLQASESNLLRADYPGMPGWDDNAATFSMNIVSNDLHGDYQLANGYGHDKAKEVLKKHRNNFISIEDFNFLYKHGINTVRIPVGWWIAYDPNPPAPFVGGTLEVLDNAFTWAQTFSIKCIIDLHAAPGSQNGMEHSASRDGKIGWPTSPDYISQTLHVIEFLASRYAKHPSLLGIELLNEPSAESVPLDTLVSFYKQGYQIVRDHSSTAYVIFCQRIGNADPIELYQANLGSANTVIDLHYYNLFNTFFSNMSSLDNIQFIYKSRQTQIQALTAANGPLIFIGEWTNEWNVSDGSPVNYRDFGRAQIEVYNGASFGWAYWTLKNDRKHWDFKWNLRNHYIQLGCSSLGQHMSNFVMAIGLAFFGFFFIDHV